MMQQKLSQRSSRQMLQRRHTHRAPPVSRVGASGGRVPHGSSSSSAEAATTTNHVPHSAPTSLDNLDALLGGEGGPDSQADLHPDQQLVPWWSLKPRQSAPPRQQLMHQPGDVARFVVDQPMYSTKVRSGRSTRIGGELDIPQVDPYFCYLVMATQLAVYGAGTWLAVSQGPHAAEQWARELAMQPTAVEAGESWRLVTSMLLHGGLTHLALDTFFLGWMGPGIEALLGHGVFLYIYSFSGLAGAVACLLFAASPYDPVSCSSAATLGLIGAMLGYELANGAIVQQSIKSRPSKADDGRQGSAALRKPWGALGITALMVGLGFMPGSMVDNAAHVGGLLAGLGLGYCLGPRFSLIQEVDIPVGSMTVPDDAPATVVVLDRRTGLERVLAGAAALGVLAGIVAAGSALKHTLG